MKETVKGRVIVSMDALVQQTKSPFTVGVLHFPLQVKFRMPQIEAFDGTKDPVDHLNTYKTQMELHGYQYPVQCKAFAITLKGSALAWLNRLPPASISSFRELSIAFVSHYRSPDVQEAELPPANRKARPTGESEILCPEVQLGVIKGRHTI